jgi:hypothetical protein
MNTNTQLQPVNTTVEINSTAIANDETSNASFCNRTVAKILPSLNTIQSALIFTLSACFIGVVGGSIAKNQTNEGTYYFEKDLIMSTSIISSTVSGAVLFCVHKIINFLS